MRLSFQDRIHVSLLCSMVASGFVMVAVWEWPRGAKVLLMTVVGIAVLLPFGRWIRAADDFKDSSHR